MTQDTGLVGVNRISTARQYLIRHLERAKKNIDS
jgi:hypothetical protein